MFGRSKVYFICKMKSIFKRKGVEGSFNKSSETVFPNKIEDVENALPPQNTQDTPPDPLPPPPKPEKHKDPSHRNNFFPFSFPTLGDLPGLLMSSTVGAVFQNSQAQQIRNKFFTDADKQQEQSQPEQQHHPAVNSVTLLKSQSVDIFRNEDVGGNVLIETMSAFDRKFERGPFQVESVPNVSTPAHGRHFVRIPVVSKSGHTLLVDEVEVTDALSEQQVVPNELNAFLALHQHHKSELYDENENSFHIGLWRAAGDKSKESVDSGYEVNAVYFRRIYFTLTFVGLVAIAYLGAASAIFYKYIYR